MTSTDLVGPVKVVRFWGGPRGSRGRFDPTMSVIYDLPRNTLDPRFRACTDHHLACDCREAELGEDINEYRADYRGLRDALHRAVAGHDAHTCRCGACGIARETHLTFLAVTQPPRRTQ